MDRRTVRRGFAVLAFAVILGVAGVSPAAAEEIGFFERSLRWLSGLWQAQDAAAEGGLLSIWAANETEKGMGLDPNGGTPQTVAPPPESEENQ